MDFAGKNYWAVILGGSSGLGLGTAKVLASKGMNLCIVHRDRKENAERLSETWEALRKESIQVITFNSDALKKENRETILQQLKTAMGGEGRVRLLLHSIAKGNLKPMYHPANPTLTNADFHLTIDAMAISLYDWTMALVEEKLFLQEARVISFTSEGNTKAWPYYGAVSAAKAALEAISRNLALEIATLGITTNCIQAGATQTPALEIIPGSKTFLEHAKKRNPNQRLTLPKDIGNVVYLLCKDEARWINGTTIIADGGEHLQS